MLREIYKVNEEGFILDNYVGEFDEEGVLVSPEGEFVTEPLPQPLFFYHPRWNGSEWVEGESEYEREEREALERLNSLHPSPAELEDAKTEIKIITLLTELELI